MAGDKPKHILDDSHIYCSTNILFKTKKCNKIVFGAGFHKDIYTLAPK